MVPKGPPTATATISEPAYRQIYPTFRKYAGLPLFCIAYGAGRKAPTLGNLLRRASASQWPPFPRDDRSMNLDYIETGILLNPHGAAETSWKLKVAALAPTQKKAPARRPGARGPCPRCGEKGKTPLVGRRRPALPRTSSAVPSALGGLTSGFGTGPGVPPLPWPPANKGRSPRGGLAPCPGGRTALQAGFLGEGTARRMPRTAPG